MIIFNTLISKNTVGLRQAKMNYLTLFTSFFREICPPASFIVVISNFFILSE